MGLLDKLLGRKTPTAAKQEGDAHAPDARGDPRGGVQNDEYRHAAPTDVVDADGVVMSGPAGAPPDDTTPEQRREADRP
jgi:hypothetical protein